MTTTTANATIAPAARRSDDVRVIGAWLPVLAIITVALAVVAGVFATVQGAIGVAVLGVLVMLLVAGLRSTHDLATNDHLL